LYIFGEKSVYWKKWLDEVDIIMTRSEKSVFKNLKTEEDIRRFQKLFWKARDTNPETPQNEYKIKFYTRLEYAENHLGGMNSDPGQIYILLGEPLEKRDFSGYDKVVNCQLWVYKAEGRPGLPPFMNLIFFKPWDFVKYKLFHPGFHSPMDILSPGYKSGVNSRSRAYRLLKMSFPELAQATLSIIPGEGDPYMPSALTSSGSVISQIYTLPDKEVENNYLINFDSIEGTVDVMYSTSNIGGEGNISISENNGFKFLNYSIMPESVNTEKIGDDLYKAKISLNIRIENLKGETIHQQERKMDLKFNEQEKKILLEEKKIVFRDFLPIIEGEFNVNIAFLNKTTEEFFVHKERINITDEAKPVLLGYKLEKNDSDKFIAFCNENYRVLSDPRLIFNKEDLLQGVIITDQRPEISLISVENENYSVKIKNITKEGDLYLFKQPLKDLKSDHYYLNIINEEGKLIYEEIISVLSFYVKKPVAFERSDPSSSKFNYIFLMAQQYLNKGDVGLSLEYFKNLPERLWNSTTIPVIARAYYIKEDYKKVIDLLEREGITKNYKILLLLANSSLELRKLEKAAEYFEMIRKYGDTVKINQTLGAIYHSLGDKEKAKVYWNRAKKLREKSEKEDNITRGEQDAKNNKTDINFYDYLSCI